MEVWLSSGQVKLASEPLLVIISNQNQDEQNNELKAWCCIDNKRYFGSENSRFNFTVSLVLHFHLDSSDDSDN